MGQFIRYLQGLTPNDFIDSDIMDIIYNPPYYPKFEETFAIAYVSSIKYNFVYVPWKSGAISIGECYSDQDILSTDFSGCYLARIVGTGNHCCCYHIHKDSVRSNYKDQKDNWNAYVGNLSHLGAIRSGSLFRPDRNYHRLVEANAMQILWGLIAADGGCYSAIVERSASMPRTHRLLSIVYQGRGQQLTIP